MQSILPGFGLERNIFKKYKIITTDKVANCPYVGLQKTNRTVFVSLLFKVLICIFNKNQNHIFSYMLY